MTERPGDVPADESRSQAANADHPDSESGGPTRSVSEILAEHRRDRETLTGGHRDDSEDPSEPAGTGEPGDSGDLSDPGDSGDSGDERRTPTTGDKVRTGLRGIGQTLITLGVVVALFIVYEAFITDIFNQQKQDALKSQLEEEWEDPTVGEPQQETTFGDIPVGDAFGVMRIPSFGADYAEAVVQGTTDAALEKGPGHYTDTAGPGEIGNFAVAGHRVGKGSPFLNLDKLVPGDAIVIETEAYWYVYRVIGDPSTGDFADPNYPAPGQEITAPGDYDQIAPVPDDASATPTQAILTLTTCHPKFSAAERLIIHAYLDGEPLSKAEYPEPGDVPALTEG